MKKNVLLILAGLYLFASCKKEAGPVAPKNVDIYIAGTVRATNGKYVAVYWKNGVINKLTDSTADASALGVAINGSDVYVAGNHSVGHAIEGVYWKNSSATVLGLNTVAKALAISGNDIYIAGINTVGPAYWKNSTMTQLTGKGSLSDCEGCIVVSGNDVYIAGTINYEAGYWKNNTPVQLSTGTSGNLRITCLALSGTNVYVGGTTDLTSNIAYWKNNAVTILPQQCYGAGPSAMVVVGADVYLAGNSLSANGYQVATYWKNNIATQLSNQNYASRANGISVANNSVYVSIGNNAWQPTVVNLTNALLYADGTTKILNSGVSNAYGVVAVQY
jgi:hypothetical protein